LTDGNIAPANKFASGLGEVVCHIPKVIFKAIEREETLAAQVTDRLERLIVGSALRPGSKLPAERELAERFGVSRTVIREAMRSLAGRGMVAVKAGSGTVVQRPSAENLGETMALCLRGTHADLDHGKISEVRRLLEVEIAGLAAERRSEDDIRTMVRILDDQAGLTKNREKFVRWDIAFHSALATATQNELFPILLGSVVSTLRKVREYGFNVPATPDRAIYFHRLILEKVTAGNRKAARQAMEEHLAEAEGTMREGMDRAGRSKRK
jgi:GntR family transcriptional regulator, transcriptional repressor for pyruvate dehydrogenase complex